MTNKKISALTGATTPLGGTELVPIVQSGATDSVSVANLTAGRAVAVKNVTATDTAAAPFYRALNGAIGLGNTAELQLDCTNNFSGFSKTYIKNESQTGGNSAADLLLGVNDNGGGAPYDAIRIKGIGGDVQIKVGNLVQGTAAKGINFTANTPAAGMTSQLLNWYEEGTWTPSFTGWSVNPTGTCRYTRVGKLVTLNMTMQGGTTAGGATIGGLPFTVGVVGACANGQSYTNASIAIAGVVVDASTNISYINAVSFGANFWAMSATYMI